MFYNVNFGIGPRRCIGEQYARVTARCMVASFVGRLETAPVDASSSHFNNYEQRQVKKILSGNYITRYDSSLAYQTSKRTIWPQLS